MSPPIGGGSVIGAMIGKLQRDGLHDSFEPPQPSASAEPPASAPAEIPMVDVARPRGFAPFSDVTLALVLLALAVLPYANTLLNGFVYDDNTQVLNNPYILNFRHLRDIFSTTVWSYVGAQGVTNYYRPMMTFGYLICYKLFGPVAFGFHLASVVLHAAVVLLLFFVTLRMFRNRALAVVAAGLFALHPVHTESVAWIAAVTDLELTFFYLLTFRFFLGLEQPEGKRLEAVKLAMVVSFALALLAKEQALTLPALATVYEHVYRDDRATTRWRQKLSRYGALWLLAIAYLLFRVRFLGSLAPVNQMPSLTGYQAALSALALVGQYLWKLVWPVHLSAFYVFQKSGTMLDPRVIAGAAAVALTLAGFLALWSRASRDSRGRLASFGFVWLLAALAPVLNARWMAANVFAERYLYLPSVGFCWLAAWGWMKAWESAPAASSISRRALGRPMLAGLLGAVALLAAARITIRNRDWRNDIVLYTKTLAQQPDAYHIRNNLGVDYWNGGDAPDAEREWERALVNAPHNAVILNNLGLAATRRRDYADAVRFFRRAIELKPKYTDPHLNLGEAYLAMGERDQAELQLRAAVALSPLNHSAHNRLGKLCLDAGRVKEAAQQFLLSVQSEPNVVGYNALGDIDVRLGDPDAAARAYQRALTVNRFDSHAHFALAVIEAARGETAEALSDYQAGLESDPHNRDALEAVAKLTGQAPGGQPPKP